MKTYLVEVSAEEAAALQAAARWADANDGHGGHIEALDAANRIVKAVNSAIRGNDLKIQSVEL